MKDSQHSLRQILAPLRGAFIWSVVFSLGVNLLLLTVPLYLLQVFDRVLGSRSVDTLWALTLIAVAALVAYGLLEACRRLILSRVGLLLESSLAGFALDSAIKLAPLSAGSESAVGVRDLQTLRAYLGGQGLLPLLDAPWSIIFLAVVFALHPALGWLSLGVFVLLALLGLANEAMTREAVREGSSRAADMAKSADDLIENSEVVLALGMRDALLARWQAGLGNAQQFLQSGTSRLQALSSVSRVARLMVQVAVLATGALLVLAGEISAGAMIAASILVTRALAPIDQLIGSWGSTVNARAAWARVRALADDEAPTETTRMPAPAGRLQVDGLTYVHPGQEQPALQAVSLSLEPGESLGIIGPTGSGKTTLARCLLGVLPPRLGSARLDGISLADWDTGDRGQYVGYLPQDVELFAGTVAENIARFRDATPEATVRAAQIAGAHELILALPQGYDTPIGPRGVTLSGGQRQRIALARALFGDVRFVILDEPNANQDRVGEVALLRALRHLKDTGITSVVIAHRPAIIQFVDKVLVLRNGKVAALGPREAVLAQLGAADANATHSATPGQQ